MRRHRDISLRDLAVEPRAAELRGSLAEFPLGARLRDDGQVIHRESADLPGVVHLDVDQLPCGVIHCPVRLVLRGVDAGPVREIGEFHWLILS